MTGYYNPVIKQELIDYWVLDVPTVFFTYAEVHGLENKVRYFFKTIYINETFAYNNPITVY